MGHLQLSTTSPPPPPPRYLYYGRSFPLPASSRIFSVYLILLRFLPLGRFGFDPVQGTMEDKGRKGARGEGTLRHMTESFYIIIIQSLGSPVSSLCFQSSPGAVRPRKIVSSTSFRACKSHMAQGPEPVSRQRQ